MVVCLDWVGVKEQRVQQYSVENEWEEALKHFEQGQKQGHYQVRKIKFDNYIYSMLTSVAWLILHYLSITFAGCKNLNGKFFQISNGGKD